MHKIVKVSLLFLSLIILQKSNASVIITLNQKHYEFENSPYLVDVLSPIAHLKNWYWPNAALYKSENIQLNKTKSQLINKLSALIKHYKKDKPDVASSLRELKKSIQNWQLARKLTTKIDYDLARIVKSANSRIPAGKYILTITPRQKTVKIFGAIHKEINVAHLPHADASEYIQSHVRSELADKDYVIIIQADGRIIKSPVAYWNKTHQEVMPGSQIFIPFKPALFNSDFDLINQKLLLLASNRVL